MTKTTGGLDASLVDLAPLGQPKQAELVANRLRAWVVTSASVGDVLPPERVLIEQFGVSRPSVREALRILEFEGLIAIRRGVHGGAVVQPPGLDDLTRVFGTYLQRKGGTVREIYALRATLEAGAARMLCERAAEVKDVIDAQLATERSAIEAPLLRDGVAEEVVDFHRMLLRLTGDQTLLGVGSLLDAVSNWHAAASLDRLSERDDGRAEALRAGHAAHVAIADAIKAGDPAAAERRVRRHLEALRVSASDDDNDPIAVVAPLESQR